jgi:hypothetical protein
MDYDAWARRQSVGTNFISPRRSTMMQGKWNRCLSRIGGVALIGGLALASYSGGVIPAEAHNNDRHGYNHPNPFKQILNKLDEVLTKFDGARGGGEAGSYTMRWDANNPSASRFTVLADFGNAAVRDNNTGLVWEKLPSGSGTWLDARLKCLEKNVGGTRGWRLPSVVELVSLIDASPGAPVISVVFEGVSLVPYWSATTNAASNNTSLSVDFGSIVLVGATGKTNGSTLPYWCVRGSMGESTY